MQFKLALKLLRLGRKIGSEQSVQGNSFGVEPQGGIFVAGQSHRAREALAVECTASPVPWKSTATRGMLVPSTRAWVRRTLAVPIGFNSEPRSESCAERIPETG